MIAGIDFPLTPREVFTSTQNTGRMQTVTVALQISSRRFQAYYAGQVDTVVALADDGRTVQFPARVLRPFLTQRGIRGVFEITYSAQQKFHSIRRVDEDNAVDA